MMTPKVFGLRAPDLAIGPRSDPQTARWHLWLPKWMRDRKFQLVLHRWYRSDSDRALHDHSGDNISILLTGRYREWLSHSWEPKKARVRLPFIPYFRKGERPHRIELLDGPMWTLWLRWPPRREWGFWCPRGWKHWSQYLAEKGDYYKNGTSTVGPGCG